MKKAALVLIFFVAFTLRFVLLDKIPPSIANDEINIILNAQSFLKTGQNIPGVVTGIFGKPDGDLSGGIHSEISSYLLIPALALFGLNLASSKLTFVLISLGIVFIIYKLIKKLVNEEAAIFAAILASLNPWLIFFGRSAYESIISTFFYLLALYLVISRKGKQIFWALPFFIAGFLSYFSAKTILLPLTLFSIYLVKQFQPKQSLRPIIILNLIVILFLLVYSFLLTQGPAGGRFAELKNPNIKKIVDAKRTTSMSFPLSNLFENKYTEDLRLRLKAALGGYYPSYLFLDGQPESIPSLSIPDHGFLYLIDLPLVLIGLAFLVIQNKKVLMFLLGLLGITAIPNFLNLAGTTYSIRTVILFPILTTLSSLGLYYFKVNLFRRKFGKILILATFFLYLLFVGNYLYIYFARLPIERAQGWFLHQEIASRYIKLTPMGNKVIAVVSDPKHFFYRYLFFAKIYQNSNQILQINKNLALAKYTFSNFEVINSCPEIYNQAVTYLIDRKLDCKQDKGIYIADIKDGGDEYIILNDKVCFLNTLKTYPLIKDYTQLDIDKLSVANFCGNYITVHGT